MGAFTLVQKQFFPTANRPELIVDMKLAQGASWTATDREVRKLEKWLGENPDVAFYTAYVGAGSPRFYLPTVPELANANFGQVIVMTKDLDARERVFAELDKLFASDFEAVRARVQRLQNGPPVGLPRDVPRAGRRSRSRSAAWPRRCGRSSRPIRPRATSTSTGTSLPRRCGSRSTRTRRGHSASIRRSWATRCRPCCRA